MSSEDRLKRQLGAKRRELADAEFWAQWFASCDNPCPGYVAMLEGRCAAKRQEVQGLSESLRHAMRMGM